MHLSVSIDVLIALINLSQQWPIVAHVRLSIGYVVDDEHWCLGLDYFGWRDARERCLSSHNTTAFFLAQFFFLYCSDHLT